MDHCNSELRYASLSGADRFFGVVAADLMLLDLIAVRVHCIVCIVCDWRSHDYLVVQYIVCMVCWKYVLGFECASVCTLYI